MSTPDIKIKLGMTVKDAATGFQGVCNLITEQLNGNFLIAIQPVAKEDNTMSEAMFFDYHMVDIVDKGVSERALPLVESPIMPGMEVRDIPTGFLGTVTSRTWYLNGCFRVKVESKVSKDNEVKHDYFEHERLEVIPPKKSDEPKPEVKQTKAGGPITKVPKGLR